MSLYDNSYNKNEEDKYEYIYKVHQYYIDCLNGVKLDENNIYGTQGWNNGIYEYIVYAHVNLMIDEEEFNKNICFYIAENRDGYGIYPSKYIYFYYKDKCYEIYLAYDKWDNFTGNFEVCGEVYVHDKSYLCLNSIDLHLYHDPGYRSKEYEDGIKGEYFEFQLEDSQNLISEVIKRFRGNNKKRNRNDSNNKGM